MHLTHEPWIDKLTFEDHDQDCLKPEINKVKLVPKKDD